MHATWSLLYRGLIMLGATLHARLGPVPTSVYLAGQLYGTLDKWTVIRSQRLDQIVLKNPQIILAFR